MRDALKAYLALASGLAEVPRQKAVAAAKSLVAQGEATAEQVSTLTEELLTQARANREAVSGLAKYEVDRALSRVGLVTAEEVAALNRRIASLEAEVRRLGGKPAPARKAAAGRATAREAAKATPADRSTAKKAAPTKRTATKRTATKRTATKRTATKPPPATKPPAKTGPIGDIAAP